MSICAEYWIFGVCVCVCGNEMLIVYAVIDKLRVDELELAS